MGESHIISSWDQNVSEIGVEIESLSFAEAPPRIIWYFINSKENHLIWKSLGKGACQSGNQSESAAHIKWYVNRVRLQKLRRKIRGWETICMACDENVWQTSWNRKIVKSPSYKLATNEQRKCISGNRKRKKTNRGLLTHLQASATTMKYRQRLSTELRTPDSGTPDSGAFTLHNKPDYGGPRAPSEGGARDDVDNWLPAVEMARKNICRLSLSEWKIWFKHFSVFSFPRSESSSLVGGRLAGIAPTWGNVFMSEIT